MDSRGARADVADVVVVGGGMAGLTAAAFLAREGVSVTLFEKAPSPGGRAATLDFDGFLFNRGGHALYTGGAASEILAELGVHYGHGIPKDTYVLSEGEISPFPATLSGMLRTDLLSFGDKLAFMRFFATLGSIKPHTLSNMSARAWLDLKVRRPRLRKLMTALSITFTYTTALDLVSAEMLVEKMQRSLKHPIHYVDGGWQTLVDGTRKAAQSAGARILTGATVEGIETANGRATGVRLRGGDLIEASDVVLATSPREAVRAVDGEKSPELQRIVDGLTPVATACLDVALSHLPAPESPIVQDIDGPRFASAQSLYSWVAPEGGALVIAFKQLDPRESGDPREDERDLEDFLDVVQPGWRDVLVRRQYLPRIESVGALPAAESGGFAGRPDYRVPDLGNLYLAGDWVGPEGFLVDASMASARRAAELILDGGSVIHGRTAVGTSAG